MSVTRLRAPRDARGRNALETVAGVARDALSVEPSPLLVRIATLAERGLSAQSGWEFVMIDVKRFAEVNTHLRRHSEQPMVAMDLFARLFGYLPPDGNEVEATRAELARVVGCTPRDVSRIMGELEAIGAVYRLREGRGVRYFVNPVLGTHLAGAARDRAQGEAPKLRLVERNPAE